MSEPTSEHYAALGLKSDATLADIKKAFRQKASQFHPDRNLDEDAPARFRAAQEAYDDNRRRSLLDDPADTAREIWHHYFQPLLKH
jgi:DnaJ-class molecular chaperone